MKSIYNSNNLKPIYRSKLRLRLGKTYYTLNRFLYWWFGMIKFAKKQEET
jgi:vancomycin resistance protein VanW